MAPLLAATVIALAPVMGADHPKTPVQNSGWSAGVSALVNGPNRVHGYFVNWNDVFFFKGNAKTFNAFLSDYAKIPGARRRLILHPGKLEVRSPWDKKPRDLEANWRMVTNSVKLVNPTTPEPEREVLELWLGGGMSEKQLVIPKEVKVEKA